MLKYVDTLVSFQEVPDEISLCINISNCPNECEGCHSAYLKENIGTPLTHDALHDLITKNKGISCVAFLGGDASPEDINSLAMLIRVSYQDIKVAWYSGIQEISDFIDLRNFDYIKVGPYIEKLGPLSSTTTNQIMYKIEQIGDEVIINDITYKFWK